MCSSRPRMPPPAAPAPPPIPDATPGAVAPILGNQQTKQQRFDALRELSLLVIPQSQVISKPVAPVATPVTPPPPPRYGTNGTALRPTRGASSTNPSGNGTTLRPNRGA